MNIVFHEGQSVPHCQDRENYKRLTHTEQFPNIIVIGLQFFKMCPENAQVYIGENMS